MPPSNPFSKNDSDRASRPNIIFIMMDDVGFGDVGAYGGTIPTPTMDRLALEGLKFDQYYTKGAVCSPTRASILTGLDPQRFGFSSAVSPASGRGIPTGVPTLPGVLRQAGYETWHVGKWHLGLTHGFHPADKGFDRTILLRRDPRTYQDPVLQIDNAEPRMLQGHATQVLTEWAIGLVQNHRLKASPPPFFLSLWYWAPHSPLEPPSVLPEHCCCPDLETKRGRFEALLCNADFQISRLLQAIDEPFAGLPSLARDTLFVVTSDNGGSEGWHESNGDLRGFKGETFEGGIRVPLVARWEGQTPPGTAIQDVVVSTDWFPSLTALAGVDASPMELSGTDVSAIFRGEGVERPPGERIFWESRYLAPKVTTEASEAENWGAVREEPWKLVVEPNLKTGSDLRLYDVVADPGEETDQAADYPEIVSALREHYLERRRDLSRVDYAIERLIEGADSPSPGRFVFLNPGAAILRQQDEHRFVRSGEMTFRAKILPAALGQRQVIAKLPGSWRIALDADGRVSLRLTLEDHERVVLTSAEPLASESWASVAFTIRRRKKEPVVVRLYADDGVVEKTIQSSERVRITGEPVVVGAASERANRPFLGEIDGLDFFLLALYPEQL